MVSEHRDFSNRTILTPREVANYLDVHVRTVKKWQNQGLILGYRAGPRGYRKFRLEELESFSLRFHYYLNING